MTTLPPLRDEQWDDLCRRFPSTLYPTVRVKVGRELVSRPQIDALRAAGLWREHDDLSCNDEGVRCAIRDAKERIDPDFEMPDPAPVERFTTKRHSGRIAIHNNDAWVGNFFFECYGEEVAQEAADACVVILRQKHAKPGGE